MKNCSICQKSKKSCVSWCHFPCQHGICFTCFEKMEIKNEREKKNMECSVCGDRVSGSFSDYNRVTDKKIVIHHHNNFRHIRTFLRKVYKQLIVISSNSILFYLLVMSIYGSTGIILSTGWLTNCFRKTETGSVTNRYWLAFFLFVASVYVDTFDPIWYGILWDIMLTHKKWSYTSKIITF